MKGYKIKLKLNIQMILFRMNRKQMYQNDLNNACNAQYNALI